MMEIDSKWAAQRWVELAIPDGMRGKPIGIIEIKLAHGITMAAGNEIEQALAYLYFESTTFGHIVEAVQGAKS